MLLFTLDLEGVFIPEIWIAVAKKTGIKELSVTTRDEPDYDKLMRYRLNILDRENITIDLIKEVIGSMDPFEGAKEFLNWLKSQGRTIILSDTFEQFAEPMMAKLDYPTLFCHELIIGQDKMIKGYKLRTDNQKKRSVDAFHELNFKVIAAGDSYNDLAMLRAADNAVLYCPTEKFAADNADLPVANDYKKLKELFTSFINKHNGKD